MVPTGGKYKMGGKVVVLNIHRNKAIRLKKE
jgi:hypothetical protein